MKYYLKKIWHKIFPPKEKIEFSIGIYTGSNPLKMTSYEKNPVLTRENVTDRNAAYVADPFIVKKDGFWYMFFEVRNKGSYKTELAYAISREGFNWEYQKVIPIESGVQSYPYIFEENGNYYMIPESYPLKSIRLYKARKFPEEWVLEKVLIVGGNYVDSSIIKYNEKWWLFASTTQNQDLYLFYADNLIGPWKEHPNNPIIKDDKSSARPGGRIIEYNGDLYRFAQDCSKYYGEQILGFKITKITPEEYEEEPINENPIIGKDLLGWNNKGMHTFNAYQISTNKWIAVVDGYKEIK